jgi:hypothetical protein
MATKNSLPNTTTSSTTTIAPIPHTTLQKSHCPTFPISNLPYELRQLIYASYLSFLPPLQVSSMSLRPFPCLGPIHSPSLFACDLFLPCFYQNITFAFNSVADLLLFSRPPQSQHVRRIRIQSHQDKKGGDWVYICQKCFPSLESIVFALSEDKELQYDDLEGWWERVIDALREGRGARRRDMTVSVDRGGGECLTEVL